VDVRVPVVVAVEVLELDAVFELEALLVLVKLSRADLVMEGLARVDTDAKADRVAVRVEEADIVGRAPAPINIRG
jgi:hypothetical protein